MAQGELGRLFYTLGIDDNDFNKKLKSAQDILKTFDTNSQKLLNLKIRVDSNLNTDAIRALAELTKQTNAKANADAKAALATQRLSAATLNQAKTDEVRARSASQSMLASQKLATEAERTAAAHQRLEAASKRASANQEELRKKAEFTNKTFLSQRVLAYQLANALGTTFSLYAVGAFVKQLAEVRGEFELQQVAIRAIIRDKEAADKIFGQVKSLAVESPFQFKDLVGYTKQLAAFSIETDKLFDTTKRLADISSGLGVDMGRIVLAYGQVKAATVLRGQELRQFTEAGIPLVDKLAEKFSKLEGKAVSAGDVFERISNRMVSFKDVDEIFKDLTSSGGMFFDMQKKQADTLYGKISNLKDAYQLMLNDIGEANDGLLKGGVNAISALMRNWDTVASVLKIVIAAYGAYKAAALMSIAVDRTRSAILKEAIVLMRANAAANVVMSREQVLAAARTNILTSSFTKLKVAMLSNPITAILTGLAALGTIVYEVGKKYEWFASNVEKGASSAKRLNESVSQMPSSKIDKLLNTYENLAGKINKSAEENRLFKETIAEIGKEVPNAVTKLDELGNAAEINMKKVIAASSSEREVRNRQTQEALTDARTRYKALRDEYDSLQGKLARSKSKGTKLAWEILSKKDEDEIVSRLSSIRGALGQLAPAIDNAKRALGLLKDPVKSVAGLGYNLKSLYEAISKLTYVGTFKGTALEYVKGSQDINTATEGLITSYNTAKDTFERMKSAQSGIYTVDQVNNAKKEYEFYKTIKEQILGIRDKKEDKEAEDAYAKSIQVRIDLIKKAKQQYEELSKAYGKTTSESIIKDRYKMELPNLQLEGDKYKDQFTKAVQDLKGHSSKQAQALKVSLNKDIKDIEQEGLMKPFEKALKDFDRFMDENKDKFDIYQKIYEITGNEEQAIQIAFGVDVKDGSIADVMKNKVVGEVQRLKDQGIFKIDFDINYDNIVKNLDKLPENVKPHVQSITDYIRNKDTEAMFDDAKLLKDTETYNQRVAAINKKWDDIIIRNKNKGRNDLAEAARKQAEVEKADANREFTDKFAQETGFFDRLFARARDISKKSLNANMANIRALSNYISNKDVDFSTLKDVGISKENADMLKGNNALLQELYDHINDLEEYANKNKDPFSQIFDGLKGFKDAKRYIKEATEATDENTKRIKTGQASIARDKGWQTVAKGANLAAEGINMVADNMERVAEITGDGKLKEAAGQLKSMGSLLGSVGQGFASGGPWGALASGITNIVGQTAEAFMQEKAEEAALLQSRTDFVNKMKLMDLELQSTDYESVFGVKSIGKAADAYKLAKKALEDYDAAINKKMSQPRKTTEQVSAGAMIFSGGPLGLGALGGPKSVTNEFKIMMAAYKKGYTELQGLAVKTKDRSGWANFWGSKDQYKALKDYAPELWGSDGVFSVEKAKAFLATDSKINDAQKKQIQNVIDLKEAYDKNMEIVRQDISDTFGVLGSAVTDSLADSIMNGVDAWSEFTKAGSTSLETLGKKMAYELFFSKKFSNLQKQLEETYGTGQTEEVASQQMAILSDFFSNIKGDMANAKAWMEEWKKKAAESGFDIWSVSTEAAGLQGEIKGIKEDTAQLLASLLNAVRADVSVQNIHLTDIKGILSSTQGSIATSLAYLAKIDANVYNLLMAFNSVVGGKGSVGAGIRVWA